MSKLTGIICSHLERINIFDIDYCRKTLRRSLHSLPENLRLIVSKRLFRNRGNRWTPNKPGCHSLSVNKGEIPVLTIQLLHVFTVAKDGPNAQTAHMAKRSLVTFKTIPGPSPTVLHASGSCSQFEVYFKGCPSTWRTPQKSAPRSDNLLKWRLLSPSASIRSCECSISDQG